MASEPLGGPSLYRQRATVNGPIENATPWVAAVCRSLRVNFHSPRGIQQRRAIRLDCVDKFTGLVHADACFIGQEPDAEAPVFRWKRGDELTAIVLVLG